MAPVKLGPLQRATYAVTALVMLLALVGFVSLVRSLFVDPWVDEQGEYVPPEEAATIPILVDAAVQQIDNASKPDGLYKRDAHPAPHGCVQASFQVRKDLPEELAQGVFACRGHSYQAWLRFSNGLFFDDQKKDARGMAIKLMDAPCAERANGQAQRTQDFVMINNPTFPVKDVVEYRKFFELQVAGDTFGYFIGFNPADWHLRELIGGLGMLKQPASPLAVTYHSMLPFRLGSEHVMKFSTLPCDPEQSGHCEEWKPDLPKPLSSHYLRDAMVSTLQPSALDTKHNEAAARFVFRVQLKKPGRNMPIEDASIKWSEDDSPFIEVADITIPAQRFSSPEQNRFCENLSFAPWHALPEHEPLGGLNRARRVVYEAISKTRHERNGVPRREPRGFCIQPDGQPCLEPEQVAQ